MNILIYLLIVTHLSSLLYTMYLHRGQSHRSVQFHPVVEHIFRFYLFLYEGVNVKQWVALHRKHHKYTDTIGDPHSPHTHPQGFWGLVFLYSLHYVNQVHDHILLQRYGQGTPNDWIERVVYSRYYPYAPFLLLVIEIIAFGWVGIGVWLIHTAWIPICGVAAIYGLTHLKYLGYRNQECKNQSRNIFPIGIIFSGDELHNNHHSDPTNPKFSRRWFEFDESWMWIRLLMLCRLAKLRKGIEY